MDVSLTLFGRTLEFRTKALPPLRPITGSGAGWYPIIREPYTGAWQSNVSVEMPTVLTYSAVYACVTLIAGDIAKLCLRLVEQDGDGIWTEIESPAFSPFLRKPNRYQTITKFIEQWVVSKLTRGNTYVLKQRDGRGLVTAGYVLDPSRVTPLVSPDGAVYYKISRDDLAEVSKETLTVPASEIFHDIMCALYHPLIGVSPIYACGVAAMQGLAMQNSSTLFFQNKSTPEGILTAPVGITTAQAETLQAAWKARAAGDIAVLAGELKYQQLTMSAVDAQLIEQLKWTADTVCSCFHVPPYMIGVGPPPPYANVEPLLQQYYSQCIQTLLVSLEKCLDEGLGLDVKIDGKQYGTEFDIDDLIWMDTSTKVSAAKTAVDSGSMSPNEARKKYHGLGPVEGGGQPFMQHQMWPVKTLAERDIPNASIAVQGAPPPVVSTDGEETEREQAASFREALRLKAIQAGLYAA